MEKRQVDIDEYRNHLKNYFLKVAPDTCPETLNNLVQQFEFEKFYKKQLIYREGSTSDTVYFVCKGLIRLFYNKEEKEITNLLVPENSIVVGAYSILTGEKNYSNYEAFEDTEVLKLKYTVLESFYARYHSMEHLGRILVEKYYTSFMKKTYEVLFLSAEERYSIFMRDHSDLLKRVPLKYIASYLGVSQETLSRLRSKY